MEHNFFTRDLTRVFLHHVTVVEFFLCFAIYVVYFLDVISFINFSILFYFSPTKDALYSPI